MAKIFIGLGILFLLISAIYMFFPNAFSWFGRMPGDVNYRSEGGGFSFHFPIVTMIIVSIILTIILNLFKRPLHKPATYSRHQSQTQLKTGIGVKR